MTKKPLENIGIAPKLLLKDIEVTAPFLFKGELNTDGPQRAYLAKLVHYKKNPNALKTMDLGEYFHMCLAAHWSTAGTFVPTNVDNQIREGLWKHPDVNKHIERMGQLTVESWSWDYSQVTNRKSYNPHNGQVMSTHEGTWLSVAIGGYIALKRKNHPLAQDVADVILAEIEKEEKLLIELRERRDHINFLRSSALMAHNFGDLDRVIDQWMMEADAPFRLRIYKLGHQLNSSYSPILAYTGQVNKRFLSVENHRHMSMRQARCLRRSQRFLIPVGPFMDEWGRVLGSAPDLTPVEKAEVIAALFEGFNRQNKAMGYARAYRGFVNALPQGLETLVRELPFDLPLEIKKSPFGKIAATPEEDFLADYRQQLEDFVCPLTGMTF
jgi:hypothetical protein